MNDTSVHSGNHRPDWEDTWFDIAEVMAKRSLCKTKVGAIIVDKDNRPVSSGYNGPPRGFYHDERPCIKWCSRAKSPSTWTYDDCPSLHAEQNALMTADRSSFKNGSIYVTSHLCFTCAKLIANSGLSNVYVSDYDMGNYNKRNSKNGYELLLTCGLNVMLLGMLDYE